eukprot:CAMPEP_0177612844 /NCGR_PEP_ID=MMETSP0419_2-20121207/21540_1 /TAXON_ID=582737 /ORGANISM="Tetraselmis sp., Strain GSL018" /LENGTH=39 /DNA_ID= /DNA_START= /DNA_END= /DNA_ORIENTATION=
MTPAGQEEERKWLQAAGNLIMEQIGSLQRDLVVEREAER